MAKIALTRAYIATDMQRDEKTICRWLAEIGITHSKALSGSEIERFYRKHGTSAQLIKLGLPLNLFAETVKQ